MDPSSHSAVALVSSGLDSSVALALALNGGWRIECALTFDYGQRAAERELERANRIADHFGVRHRHLRLPWFRELSSGSALLKGELPIPSPSLPQLGDKIFSEKSARAVWVPNRNGVFIEIAACLAEDLGATGIVVGFNREEGATFPDNSTAYLEAISKALSFSTSNQVRVISPTTEMDKTEIVKMAMQLRFPLELLWSCYENGGLMCGRCESCMRLKRALANNGVDLDGFFENIPLE